MKERMMIQMNMTVLCYKKCSTCQKAKHWIYRNQVWSEGSIKEDDQSGGTGMV